MKLWQALIRPGLAPALSMVSSYAGSGPLAGDWKNENGLQDEFKGYELPIDCIRTYQQAVKLHVQAVKTDDKQTFLWALENYLSLYSVRIDSGYINLIEESSTLNSNIAKIYTELGDSKNSHIFTQRSNEILERRRVG
ncbi:MAG: hypothetical protein H6696_05480 [Deferribacteres bacterium]|nr:hypothetical protein [candidate division KSB1 bacterium]MCB9501369.1 hypothetical protein [Deferribacteres bacterium]